jgi:tetratricopeptide (TPR) repeat protein
MLKAVGALLAAAFALGCMGASACAADAPTSVTAPAPAQTVSAPVTLTTAASGDVQLNGNPRAEACQNASKFGDFNGTGVDECTLALATPLLSNRDTAATLVDRGAIYMQHKQFGLAKLDFDKAIGLDPNNANAYVDRGGVLIAQKHYADAIADIDHGLSLNPDQPEKAYFNRAIADEDLKDLKSAYADYQKAAQINPNWAPAKAELARFSTEPDSGAP